MAAFIGSSPAFSDVPVFPPPLSDLGPSTSAFPSASASTPAPAHSYAPVSAVPPTRPLALPQTQSSFHPEGRILSQGPGQNQPTRSRHYHMLEREKENRRERERDQTEAAYVESAFCASLVPRPSLRLHHPSPARQHPNAHQHQHPQERQPPAHASPHLDSQRRPGGGPLAIELMRPADSLPRSRAAKGRGHGGPLEEGSRFSLETLVVPSPRLHPAVDSVTFPNLQQQQGQGQAQGKGLVMDGCCTGMHMGIRRSRSVSVSRTSERVQEKQREREREKERGRLRKTEGEREDGNGKGTGRRSLSIDRFLPRSMSRDRANVAWAGLRRRLSSARPSSSSAKVDGAEEERGRTRQRSRERERRTSFLGRMLARPRPSSSSQSRNSTVVQSPDLHGLTRDFSKVWVIDSSLPASDPARPSSPEVVERVTKRQVSPYFVKPRYPPPPKPPSDRIDNPRLSTESSVYYRHPVDEPQPPKQIVADSFFTPSNLFSLPRDISTPSIRQTRLKSQPLPSLPALSQASMLSTSPSGTYLQSSTSASAGTELNLSLRRRSSDRHRYRKLPYIATRISSLVPAPTSMMANIDARHPHHDHVPSAATGDVLPENTHRVESIEDRTSSVVVNSYRGQRTSGSQQSTAPTSTQSNIPFYYDAPVYHQSPSRSREQSWTDERLPMPSAYTSACYYTAQPGPLQATDYFSRDQRPSEDSNVNSKYGVRIIDVSCNSDDELNPVSQRSSTHSAHDTTLRSFPVPPGRTPLDFQQHYRY